MGYTVTAPVRDEVARREMSAFLKVHYRKWPAVCGKKCGSYLRGPISRDFSYDRGKCRIGFDYNASGFERQYAYAVCRWIALKVGKVGTYPDKFFPGLNGRFPIIAIDGSDDLDDEQGPWPVVLDGTPGIPSRLNWLKTSNLGMPTWRSKFRILEERLYNSLLGCGGRKLIKSEMERLDALWRSRPSARTPGRR